IVQTHKKVSVKTSELSINHIIALKHVVKLIKPLRNALIEMSNELLKALYQVFANERLKYIENSIDEVINDDVSFQKNPVGLRNQRCYAVKSGYNGLLDV
ncbi:MutS protein msh4, partial [Nowakowskiella sp. JEL0078]